MADEHATQSMLRDPYPGWKIGDTLEDPAACLGWAIEHLEIEAFSNPSKPVLAAAWCIFQALQKLQAGEPYTSRTLPPLEVTETLAAEFEKAGAAFPV